MPMPQQFAPQQQASQPQEPDGDEMGMMAPGGMMGGGSQANTPSSSPSVSPEMQAGMSSILGDQFSQFMGGAGGGAGGGGMESASPGAGMSSAMATGASQPGGSPLLQARDQFQSLVSTIQSMSQMYPMAQQELMTAAQVLMMGMVRVAEGVQQEPTAPPMGV
jgi:hypothetical protein